MGRLYAATGDGIARLDRMGGEWSLELCLVGSGAQCLAVDPADASTLYAGLREGGVRRSADGARTWIDCALPEADFIAGFLLYAGKETKPLSDVPGRAASGRRELPCRCDLRVRNRRMPSERSCV